MGYNLDIGEFTVSVCHEERSARGTVEHHASEDAPLNSGDDHSNSISPSYSVWAEFCSTVGLSQVFFAGRDSSGVHHPWWKDSQGKEHEGLLYRHPGAAPLTEEHYLAFAEAHRRYLAANPTTTEANEYNLRRLEWLVYWTRWSLDHCQWPTFANG